MTDVIAKVAQQYVSYPYPLPISDLHQFGNNPPRNCPTAFASLIWPEGRPTRKLSILVAGCGTHQGAHIAFANRNHDVFAIDISKVAIENHQQLKNKHKLQNLSLGLGSLTDVAKLQKEFDYVIATGVLHHLPNPVAGLRALESVLRPDGRMKLMVYAADYRHGIYMLQDVCRRMQIQQTPEGVEITKAVLRAIPEHHFARHFISRSEDFKYDAGIVDALLHPQDRAYSVPDVLEFVESCGLVFQNWEFPKRYAPSVIPDSNPIKAIIEKLPDREQWAIMEKLTCIQGQHNFFVRKGPSAQN